jgi:hypothetical protein
MNHVKLSNKDWTLNTSMHTCNDLDKSLNDLGVFSTLIVDLGTPKPLLFLGNGITCLICFESTYLLIKMA